MSFTLKKYTPQGSEQTVSVPASKSFLNRALVLSAFSGKKITLLCGDFSEDTRAMLACLLALGIPCTPVAGGVEIDGSRSPRHKAELNVMNAGTAARFLTVALSFYGGEYTLRAAPQMAKRPMEILHLLEEKGVRFTWLKKEYEFPFVLRSNGLAQAQEFSVNTDTSTQYASGLLLAAPLGKSPLRISLTGGRTNGTYITMSLKLLQDFGACYERTGDTVTVYPSLDPPPCYAVEADVSGACYFFALALLCSAKIFVRGIRLDSTQSDVQFLRLLEGKGVRFTQRENGLLADASTVKSFTGFDADMKDFSDQTLTAAALAPFATTPSVLRGVGHIRKQECDRIQAIVQNLNALGVPASTDGENITIMPADVRGGKVACFGDHRVAMSFALIGLKTGKITLDDPTCCKKTFENYFDVINALY